MFNTILYSSGLVEFQIINWIFFWNLIANYILESIDETVDPCENFFEFTCGAWLKKNRIPDDGKLKNFFFFINIFT
jgi:hypothetical protein